MSGKSKENPFKIHPKNYPIVFSGVMTTLFAISLALLNNHIDTTNQFSTQEAATRAAILNNVNVTLTANEATREVQHTEAYMTGVAIGQEVAFGQTQTAEALTGTPIPTPSSTPTPHK